MGRSMGICSDNYLLFTVKNKLPARDLSENKPYMNESLHAFQGRTRNFEGQELDGSIKAPTGDFDYFE